MIILGIAVTGYHFMALNECFGVTIIMVSPPCKVINRHTMPLKKLYRNEKKILKDPKITLKASILVKHGRVVRK